MRTRFVLLLAALTIAVAAGVAGASALVPTSDPPTGPERVQPDGSPPTLGAVAVDPAGLQDWGLRLYRSQDGSACAEAGRVQDGVFGRVDPDNSFHRLDLEASGSCGTVTDQSPYTFSVSHYAASGKREAIAAIFGVATTAVQDIEVKLGDRVEHVTIDRGSFLLVVPDKALIGASSTITLVDGTVRVNQLHSLAQLPSLGAENPPTP